MKAWILFDRGDRLGARQEAMVVRSLAPHGAGSTYNERLLELLQ